MPSYRDWIREINIDVDYYSAFIKAWIAFNAWYRSGYTERSDREIIEKIKSQTNRFKTYIESFLDAQNTTEEAVTFKANLNKLQSALMTAAIFTQERSGVKQQISFSEIAISNPKTIAEDDYRYTHYKMQRTRDMVCTVLSKREDHRTEYFRFEQDIYDEKALDMHPDLKQLSSEQQGQCKALYSEIRPYFMESVLARDQEEVIFISDRAKVSRAIIEVLYLLRCSLMHGEVEPDRNSAEVYKYAYYILATIMKNMG